MSRWRRAAARAATKIGAGETCFAPGSRLRRRNGRVTARLSRSRDDGMEVRAIESEKGGRAPMEALAVEIREDSRGQDGNRGRARCPRKCGALQRVGGQGMSERVHG